MSDVLETLRTLTWLDAAPDTLRRSALKAVIQALDVDVGATCTFVPHRDEMVLANALFEGPHNIGDLARTLDGRAVASGSVGHHASAVYQRSPYDVAHPGPNRRNHFSTLANDITDLDDFRRSGIWQQFYGPVGARDQLRILIYDDRRFVRWFAAIARGRDFDEKQRAIARRLERLLCEVYIRADALERTAVENLDLSRCFAVYDTNGRLRLRSDAMADWLDGVRAERLAGLMRRVTTASDTMRRSRTRIVCGALVEVIRLDGPEGVHLHVNLEPVPDVKIAVDACLTPRQREVAACLASGATLEETARHLGISIHTVRTHTRQTYQRLGVSCRAELVSLLSEWTP